MSQVVVTEDNLSERRQASKLQESRIEREASFAKWRRSDISGRDPIAFLAGLAFAPIAAIWTVFALVIAVIFSVFKVIFKAIGSLIGNRTDRS